MTNDVNEETFLERIKFLASQLYKSTELAKRCEGNDRAEHTEDIKLCIDLINQTIKNFEHTKKAPNSGN